MNYEARSALLKALPVRHRHEVSIRTSVSSCLWGSDNQWSELDVYNWYANRRYASPTYLNFWLLAVLLDRKIPNPVSGIRDGEFWGVRKTWASWTIKALVAEETGTSFIGKSMSGEYFQQYTKLDSQTPERVWLESYFDIFDLEEIKKARNVMWKHCLLWLPIR